MDASAAVTVCALTSLSSRRVLSISAALRERGDDLRFPHRQIARLAGSERAEFDRTKLRPHQPLDIQAQRLTQPSYLSRSPFRDRDLQLPRSAPNAPRREMAWEHHAVFQLYTLHRYSCRGRAVTAHGRQIGELDLGARMCQFVRRFTICCEE